MRTFLLTATISVFVLALIIFFQNIANTITGLWILFYQFDQKTSASLGVVLLTGLGFVLGTITTMLAITLINQGKDDEAPGGSNW